MHPMTFPEWLTRWSVGVNELFGGQKGWSVCASVYSRRLWGCPYSYVAVNIINCIFFFDPNHCRKAFMLAAKK